MGKMNKIQCQICEEWVDEEPDVFTETGVSEELVDE